LPSVVYNVSMLDGGPKDRDPDPDGIDPDGIPVDVASVDGVPSDADHSDVASEAAAGSGDAFGDGATDVLDEGGADASDASDASDFGDAGAGSASDGDSGDGDSGDGDSGDGDSGGPVPDEEILFGEQVSDHDGPSLVIDDGKGNHSVVVRDTMPDTMFAFPLQKSVPFPNLMMPLLLDSQQSKDIVAKAEAHNGYVFLVLQRDAEAEVKKVADLHEVGVITRIVKTLKLPDGTMSAMTQGARRAKRVKVVREQPHLVVRVKQLVEIPAQGKRSESLFRLLQKQLQQLAAMQDHVDPGFQTALLNVEDPGQLADFTAGIVRKVVDRQRLLAEADISKRCELALQFAMAESELAALDQKIQEEMRQKAEKAQKDYFLREQLKIIRRELGEEEDPRALELARLTKAVDDANMPEDAKRRADEELTRLQTTPVESGEYSVIRNYLDWLVVLPWSKSTRDHSDLARASRVLRDDHYGLDEVKERILEFLAVRKLRPGQGGSILCFSGPPGVGKTSLGRSIARAMGRKFFRFSLGGMRDEAEIKGHRRTYVGALPGRILQGLKTCGSNNPVMLLDEIDKLGSDFRGDPSSALLEVLDPEQNHNFQDHYLDVPFDLSKVMFLATANVLSAIPEPLRDRMEILEIPGYLIEEKVEIARRHLLPKQIERHGLTSSNLSITLPVWQRMVPNYTREAGVRGLDKIISRLCRKVARQVASGKKGPGRLSLSEMEHLLGRARFKADERRKKRLPGVVQGLAWTPFGGDVLYIEAVRSQGKPTLQLTGSLGDVMSESARVALSYLRSRHKRFGIDLARLDNSNLHLHFPSGAIPKDGPSAGIAIACAFLSSLTDQPVPTDIAMTGELTVVGEVLPIGGVREKVLAAKNFGLQRVLLPKENEPDAKELKRELVRGLKIYFVEHFDDVFDLVFGGGSAPRSTTRRRVARPAVKKPAKKKPVKKKPAKKKPVKKKPAKKPAKKIAKKAAKRPAASKAKVPARKAPASKPAKKVTKKPARKPAKKAKKSSSKSQRA
jgi:ATP-dependent Lon protease